MNEIIKNKFLAKESKYLRYVGKGFHRGTSEPEVAMIQSALADDFGKAGGISPTFIDAKGELVDLFYLLNKFELYERINNMTNEQLLFYPDISFEALTALDPELAKEWKSDFDEKLLLDYQDEKRIDEAKKLGGATIFEFNNLG